MKTVRLFSVLALVVLVALGTAASAQVRQFSVKGSTETTLPPDLFKVNYFSNANTAGAPDGTVRITEPGSPSGDVCAQIYVIDPFQEMSECGACQLSPDGLRTLSVNTDLTSNPLTGVVLQTGTVSIVSGIVPPGGCTPLNGYITPTVRAWGTHIQNVNFAETETEYSDRQLGYWNDNLLYECAAIYLDGSTHGILTCGSGD